MAISIVDSNRHSIVLLCLACDWMDQRINLATNCETQGMALRIRQSQSNHEHWDGLSLEHMHC